MLTRGVEPSDMAVPVTAFVDIILLWTGACSEKKIEKVLLEDFKKVSGKNGLLFRVAEAALSDPDGSVREVVFPVVGEETLSKVVSQG